MAFPAATPRPPYFAVIFSSVLSDDSKGYEEMAAAMVEAASKQPGFLGYESLREGPCGVTISYWASEPDIERWRQHAHHLTAQRLGRQRWYQRYELRVCEVKRASSHG